MQTIPMTELYLNVFGELYNFENKITGKPIKKMNKFLVNRYLEKMKYTRFPESFIRVVQAINNGHMKVEDIFYWLLYDFVMLEKKYWYVDLEKNFEKSVQKKISEFTKNNITKSEQFLDLLGKKVGIKEYSDYYKVLESGQTIIYNLLISKHICLGFYIKYFPLNRLEENPPKEHIKLFNERIRLVLVPSTNENKTRKTKTKKVKHVKKDQLGRSNKEYPGTEHIQEG